jgi:LL-diaminopimelate aminotransferase
MFDPFQITRRLEQLPPYLFARIDQIKQEEVKKGRKLIALGIGDPDLPTPDFIVQRLEKAARNPDNHQYPSYWGMGEFRRAAARFMERRFGVKVDADRETLALIGSKEGIAHIPLAFVNPGEATLVPDPGYPVYHSATLFADGVPLHFQLREENDFLPDFAQLEALVRKGPRVRLLFLNYPNNPTGATATREFFQEVVAFAKKHEILVCHDNAYSELFFDGEAQPSFLEVPGAKDVGIEFHSLSKTFNMTGWRVGFAVGNPKMIEALARVKTNIDSGIFNACQEAAIEALDQYEPFCTELRSIYQKRRDILVPAIQDSGLKCRMPKATFYVWARLPAGVKSEDYALDLIRSRGVVSTPGTGFGSAGEGFVRFTLCSDVEVLKQVANILRGSV